MIKKIALGVAALLLVALVVVLIQPKNQCDNFELKSSDLAANKQIVAVFAPTDNFVEFDSIDEYAKPLISNALGSELDGDSVLEAVGNQLSLIVADGKPQLVSRTIVDPIDPSNPNDTSRAIKGAVKPVKWLGGCIGTSNVPVVAETDMLGALSLAAAQFSANASEHELFILGNGIQTSEPFRMQEDQFPKTDKLALKFAQQLASVRALPDLRGARVHWVGLGQTNAAVQPMPESARKSLITFWTEVIRLSNGNLAAEDVQTQVGKGVAGENAIPVAKNFPIVVCDPITLTEGDGLGFTAGQSTFLNPSKAKAKAKELAAAFKAKGCTMLLRGFAAPGVDKASYESDKTRIDGENLDLTRERANAFADLVRDAGFTDITVQSGGTCTGEDLVASFNADGSANEAGQRNCRVVEVTNG